MSLIVHANNVHTGGGAELLSVLLKELSIRSVDTVLMVDSRFTLPTYLPGSMKVVQVTPTITGRLSAERRLRQMAGQDDLIFSIGNLPPLFPVRSPVYLFIQNRYLLDRISLGSFPLQVRLRISVERLWLKRRISAVSRIMVQTPSMDRLLQGSFGRRAEILPFAALNTIEGNSSCQDLPNVSPRYDFVYVATGEPHKNHARLFEAWDILASEGIRPSICVTLPPEQVTSLKTLLDKVRKKGGVIENLGLIPRTQVDEIYRSSRALIYPSLLESFGLPLLEAQAAGLDIVAAELDYVRDVVEPQQSFDPSSSLSIARAVKRYLKLPADREHLRSAGEFLDVLLGS